MYHYLRQVLGMVHQPVAPDDRVQELPLKAVECSGGNKEDIAAVTKCLKQVFVKCFPYISMDNLELIKMETGHEGVNNQEDVDVGHGLSSFPYISTRAPLLIMTSIAQHLSSDGST